MTRTLENQTLLYDADCPLCRVYTKGFIDAGMLDENGKKPYCQLSETEQSFIDVNRASNEIALVDNVNKTVIYGIDSLLKVIGFSFPWMEKVGNFKIVKLFLKKLYSFISYNRKVIIPSRINPEIKLQCVPDFNYKWRFAYIAFAWFASSFVFYNYLKICNLYSINFLLIAILIFLQIPIQSIFLIKKNREIVLNYLGNLVTVTLFGSLVLMPILILNQIITINSNFNLIYLAITFIVMIYEHFRRLLVLELPKYLIVSYVLWIVVSVFWLSIILALEKA